jgi:hypothetical protein
MSEDVCTVLDRMRELERTFAQRYGREMTDEDDVTGASSAKWNERIHRGGKLVMAIKRGSAGKS